MPDPALEIRTQFARDRYAVVKGFIPAAELSIFYDYIVLKAVAGRFENFTGDVQVPGVCAEYADPLMEVLLANSLPQLEWITGLSLFPAYSYCRVYQRGNALAPHSDRPACEISVTICLGYEASSVWPLYLNTEQGVVRCAPAPGDALLYRGCEVVHWREPLQGDHQAQVFLHYVDQHGPCAAWKYDTRPLLGITKPLHSRS